MKKIGIVVVTYNRLSLLKEVIDSLRKQTYENRDIIVVNNGSTDDTPIWLKEQNDIKTINQDNVGGAGGFFTGMKFVTENHYDFCWIMDDDVVCEDTALSELIHAYEKVPDAGFICSRVIGINGNPMNTPAPFTGNTGLDYSDIYEKVIDHALVRVNNATFVSVLFSTSIIKEFGLPYKEYFIWGDDHEYTTRISAKKPCYIACKSVAIHKRNIQGILSFETETDPRRLKNYFYMFRNQAFTYFKTARTRDKLSRINGYIRKGIRLMLKGDFKRGSIILKAYWALISFNPQIEYPSNNKE